MEVSGPQAQPGLLEVRVVPGQQAPPVPLGQLGPRVSLGPRVHLELRVSLGLPVHQAPLALPGLRVHLELPGLSVPLALPVPRGLLVHRGPLEQLAPPG